MLDFDYLDDFDFYLAALTVLLALLLPRRYLPVERPRPAGLEEPWFFRRAYRPILAVFAASLLLNVFVARAAGIPAPRFHDEFASLLASDTFASGRLTSETHPMWKHFESLPVFHRPTYQAKCPPGPGLFLALGQIAAGEPVLGVWLSLALACAGIAWMLLAVFPGSWSMTGGLLAAACPQMVLLWGHSYWGGAVAVLGGALTFGALFRLGRRIRVLDAVTLAAGLFLLAVSRPCEGLVVSVPAAVHALLVARAWGRRDGWRPVTTRFLIPLSALLVAGGAALLYYNHRLVGDPWTLPYGDYRELDQGLPGASDPGFTFKLARFWGFFIGPVLTIAFIAPRSIFRRRESRFALGLCALLFCVSALTSPAWPHYAAPVVGLIYVVLVQGLVGLREFGLGDRPIGALLVRAVPIAYVLCSLILIGAIVQRGPARLWSDDRRAVLEMLEESDDRHLVLVRYSDRHSAHEEWVHNRADIDAADVVWARERSGPENQALLEYFRDRRVWLLLADGPPRLIPLRPAESAPAESEPARRGASER